MKKHGVGMLYAYITHKCENIRATKCIPVWVCARMPVRECEGVKEETASQYKFRFTAFCMLVHPRNSVG